MAVFEHKEYDFCTVIDYFGDILSYKDKEKNKIFQEKKSKKQNSNIKKFFPLTKKGLPNLNFKKKFNQNQFNNININTHYSNKKNEIENQDSSSAKNSDKKTISEFEGVEEINNNENPFYEDPDAPEGCIKRTTKYKKKKFPQKTLITTVKTYILEDGSEEVVTIDEVIFD